MKRKIRIYKPFIHAGMQETITYRANWFFLMIGNVIGCFVSYFIWKAVFVSSEDTALNGFTLPQMVVYIFLMFLTSTLISSGGTYDVGEEIRDGSIAMRIIKPISYNSTFLFQEIGNKLLTICILIIPIIMCVEIVRSVLIEAVEFNIIRFLLYVLSCAFAYLINFFFNICFGFTAFFIKYLWGANMMKNCIVGFLSGTIIPLSFMPPVLEKAFLLLPFASLNYTPVMIYMGMYNGASVFYYLGLQLFWVTLFYGLSKLLWNVSIRYLSIQGG